jgi:hypothetical protein
MPFNVDSAKRGIISQGIPRTNREVEVSLLATGTRVFDSHGDRSPSSSNIIIAALVCGLDFAATERPGRLTVHP